MDQVTESKTPPLFIPSLNEDEWINVLFLLSDTQNWLNDLTTEAIRHFPLQDRKRLCRKTYHLTVPALAHIVERHYYKIPRHPLVSKFTIPITAILSHLRDAANTEMLPINGSLKFKRVFDTQNVIGFDYNKLPTSLITIVTDGAGKILTAFPGLLKATNLI